MVSPVRSAFAISKGQAAGRLDDSIDQLLAPPIKSRATAHALTVVIAVVTKERHVLVVCRRDGAADAPWQFPGGIIKPGVAPEVVTAYETLAEPVWNP